MSALTRPLVVVGDIHLSRARGPELGRDLSRLVRAHPHSELVWAGDTFDLSRVQDPQETPRELDAVLAEQPELRAALRDHFGSGGTLTVLAGNHDAALMEVPCQRVLSDWLGLGANAPVEHSAWFVRRGRVHVEHGHLWDPDNAPSHPLALWSSHSEPLGIALTRRFLVPSGAWEFAHAYDTTPLAGLVGTFRRHGPRAPAIVHRYYATAIDLWLRAGRRSSTAHVERLRGADSLSDFAAAVGLEPATISALLKQSPAPRHHDRRETFRRLYLDRSGATALVVAGTLSFNPLGGALAAAAGAFLAWSLREGISRYTDEPVRRLQSGADLILELTDAEQVVLAHTHHVQDGPYTNTGTFGYARGPRPYVYIDADGRTARRWLQ